MNPSIKILNVEVSDTRDDYVENSGVESLKDLTDIALYGTSTVLLDGQTREVPFMVCTGNIYTGFSLDEHTGAHVFLVDASGNGDFPELPSEIMESRDEIEDALAGTPEVRAAIEEVLRLRDDILEAQDEPEDEDDEEN